MWTPRWVSMVGITGLKFCGSCEMPTMIWPPFCGAPAGVCAAARDGRARAAAPSVAAPDTNCLLESDIAILLVAVTGAASGTEPRVQGVAQAVAGEVEAQHREADHRAGVHGGPRGVEHVALGVVEHVAPARRGRLDAVAEIAQRRLEQDG